MKICVFYSIVSLTFCGFGYGAGINTCFDGWMSFGGSCYLFGHTALDFTEAEEYCRGHHNSHLVHIDTDLENRFIKDRLRDFKIKSWYMGLTDEDIEGIWKWFDTDTIANFTDWAPSQPDFMAEDCAIFEAAHDFSWGDVKCTVGFIPICELKSAEDCEWSIIG